MARKYCLEWVDPFDNKVRTRWFQNDKTMMKFRDMIMSRNVDGLPPVKEEHILRCR